MLSDWSIGSRRIPFTKGFFVGFTATEQSGYDSVRLHEKEPLVDSVLVPSRSTFPLAHPENTILCTMVLHDSIG